jgi:hypothetical protein
MSELIDGQYYLHENGDLIYKPGGGVDTSSSFVKKMWHVKEISVSPQDFLSFLQNASNRGAKKTEIIRLAEHNCLSKYISGWDDDFFWQEN